MRLKLYPIVLLLASIGYATDTSKPASDNMAMLRAMAAEIDLDINAAPVIPATEEIKTDHEKSEARPKTVDQKIESLNSTKESGLQKKSPNTPTTTPDSKLKESAAAIFIPPKTPQPAPLIYFSNHQTLPIDLSQDDPNRLFIPGDKIINVSCPEGFCIIDKHHLIETGDILLSLSNYARSARVFTFFISTANGAEITLLANAKAIPGQTIGFKGNTTQALPFEKGAPYTQLLVNVIKKIITAHQEQNPQALPAGFMMHTIPETLTPIKTDKGFALTSVAMIQGGVLSGQVYAIQNNQTSDLILNHASFYQKNMAAIAFSKETLKPGEVGFIYTVMQNSEASIDE